jgi:sugar/nucleoside kinase (ribokinase family)
MAKYDVYAIGNALVDIEYHATPSRLNELGIDKGVMTLIDEQQQNSLMAQLGDSHEKMACGGSAANTLIALAQMGADTYFDCRVSSDMAGQFFSRDLNDSGVDSNLKGKMIEYGVTGKCLVFVTPDADRTMNTFLGVSSELDIDDVSADAVSHSEYVYIEGYLASAENSRDAAIEARRVAEDNGVKTALTLSDPNMVKFFRDNLEAMIGNKVDLLFANEDEANGLAGTDDFNETLAYLKRVARKFAVTRGKDGSVLFDGLETITINPFKVRALDTLGAGDMFAGAFLYGLTHGMGFEQAGKLASRASAKIVGQFGPRLDQATTQALLKSFMAGN